MDNHGFTGQAKLRFAPVMETMHTGYRPPNSTRIMPVRIEGMGAEERFESLYLRGLERMFHPVLFRVVVLHFSAPLRLQSKTQFRVQSEHV
jgi:hypothetical protein